MDFVVTCNPTRARAQLNQHDTDSATLLRWARTWALCVCCFRCSKKRFANVYDLIPYKRRYTRTIRPNWWCCCKRWTNGVTQYDWRVPLIAHCESDHNPHILWHEIAALQSSSFVLLYYLLSVATIGSQHTHKTLFTMYDQKRIALN